MTVSVNWNENKCKRLRRRAYRSRDCKTVRFLIREAIILHGGGDTVKDRLFVLILSLHLKEVLLLSKVELMFC